VYPKDATPGDVAVEADKNLVVLSTTSNEWAVMVLNS